ncbi:MAG TPA: hypothetical protein VL916_18555, partial [Ilumatobacteraceae bacterium]|nr:hypothetical protein [Ilumatobacteraceae bacterium]
MTDFIGGRVPRRRRLLALGGLAVTVGAFVVSPATGASAHGGEYSLDFVASAPTTYDHTTGGGAYDDRTIGVNKDVVESLEGGDFDCNDIVTFLTRITRKPAPVKSPGV